MNRDRLDVSRRRLLAGVSGLGAFGFAGGATSAAYLSDRETASGTQRTGSVGLGVACDSCVTADGVTTFAIEGVEPGDEGTERFGLSIEGNPVRVWLRTTCPPAVDPLGEALEVRLRVAADCNAAGGRRTLYPSSGWTTLAELREALVDGVRVDDPTDPCLAAGDDPCLEFDYRLPIDAAWAGSAAGEVGFELVAQQCRHVPESDATPPFEASASGSTCPDVECETCSELGTIDLADDRLEPGETYALDERHELQVLRTTDAVDGDGNRETVCASVRLLRDAGGTGEFEESAAPPICAITVTGRTDADGESGAETRTATHDVDPPLTRTRGRICTPSDENGGDGTRPGIDSITISTCADGDENGGGNGDDDNGNGDDCIPCGPESVDRRVGGATFEYADPTGSGSVTIVITQQSNGKSPRKTVTVEDVTPGDSITVPLAGNKNPEFAFSVRDPNGDEWTLGTKHTSCSQPFGPGTTVTDGTRALTVLEAVTKDGASICEVSGS
ncbi:hypothetical protein GWK26_14040 [haloarchaeon 3A1-DGR]|nr:hypothetical protein GWK26_14040 [haloarchaeon 3A1-DGR]